MTPKEPPEPCQYEKANAVQFQSLRDDLSELKDRVRRLEEAIARGVALLIANLVGIVITLAGQIISK